MIGHILESLSEVFQDNEVFVLTSDQATDDALDLEVRTKYDAQVRRGSLSDVRSRYVDLCEEVGCDYVVRLTGDNPFVRPVAVEAAVNFAKENDLDYVSNKAGGFLPKGLDIEIIRSTTLLQHSRNYDSLELREHVTPSIIRATSNGDLRGGRIDYRLPLLRDIPLSIDSQKEYLALAQFLGEIGNNSVALALGIDDTRFQFSVVDVAQS